MLDNENAYYRQTIRYWPSYFHTVNFKARCWAITRSMGFSMSHGRPVGAKSTAMGKISTVTEVTLVRNEFSISHSSILTRSIPLKPNCQTLLVSMFLVSMLFVP